MKRLQILGYFLLGLRALPATRLLPEELWADRRGGESSSPNKAVKTKTALTATAPPSTNLPQERDWEDSRTRTSGWGDCRIWEAARIEPGVADIVPDRCLAACAFC